MQKVDNLSPPPWVSIPFSYIYVYIYICIYFKGQAIIEMFIGPKGMVDCAKSV
jgi:hypothetical protein